MSRARSEKRQQAFDMWKDSGGKMMLKDIAAALNISDDQVRQWKRKDRWGDDLETNDHVTNDSVINHAAGRDAKTGRLLPGNKVAKGHGAPKGSKGPVGYKNALGNKGGTGGPVGNDHAVKHGFFAKIFPDDEETMELLAEIETQSPLDILWNQIQTQTLAIARAQRIMWVKNKEDLTQYLKRERKGKNSEKEWEFQYAWDKYSNYLTAQSRAMKELAVLIEKYEKLLDKGLDDKERQLRIDKLQAELDKIKKPDGTGENHGEQITTLAELLNNPVPNRNIEDFNDE